ncbi:MAG: hypothetical protein IJM21_00020 [Clostridia bacterium]|nr:hypothetical protein [Clostridia bacterium]
MKRKDDLTIQALFDGLASEKAAQVFPAGEEAAPEDGEGIRTGVLMKIRKAAKRKKRRRIVAAAVASATAIMLLTAGAWAAGYYRQARVETEKPFHTVIRFDQDPAGEEKESRLFAFLPGELPGKIAENDSVSYIDFLAYWLGAVSENESGDATRTPLDHDDLEKRYGISLQTLNGAYQRLCAMEYGTVNKRNGQRMDDPKTITIEIYPETPADLSFRLSHIKGVETELTTFEGKQAVKVTVHGNYRMELSWLEEDLADEEKYLFLYYEEEGAVLVIGEKRDFGEIKFEELEEIARGIKLIDTGAPASILPPEAPAVYNVSVALG